MLKSILIEGWRFLPHSYSVVNQFQCLELLRRPDVRLYHFDIPYVDQRWKATRGLLDPASENAIASIPPPPPGQTPAVSLRIAFPYVLDKSPVKRLFVFGTAEMATVPDYFIGGKKPLTYALAANPHVTILTPSNWSRRGFIRSGANPDQVVVVPHGVDTSFLHPIDEATRATQRASSNWNGFVFLSVGAMTLNKGLQHLLKAFAAVARVHPEVQLVMKGMDSLYESKRMLLTQAKSLTSAEIELVQPRLHYKGETMPFSDIALMYQLADAYVSPYMAEGFNLPVLEAAACGLPVICTAGGSTDDFTRDEFALRIPSQEMDLSHLVPEGRGLLPDLATLVQHMLSVIEKPEIRQRARDFGPKFVVEDYTWKHVVDQLLSVMFPQ